MSVGRYTLVEGRSLYFSGRAMRGVFTCILCTNKQSQLSFENSAYVYVVLHFIRLYYDATLPPGHARMFNYTYRPTHTRHASTDNQRELL